MDYSIVIPAYNEEAYLLRTLDSVKQAMSEVEGTGELIVVDNNSNDKTAEIAKENGARVVFEPINQISRARNAGGKVAHGRFLVFVDADTQISSEILKHALNNLRGGDCSGGGAMIEFDGPVPWKVSWFKYLWDTMAPRLYLAAGSFVYCLKEGFDQVGGFSESVYASEEVWFSKALNTWGRNRGLYFKILPIPVVTSARKLDWFSSSWLMFMFVIYMIFPFAVRSKRLCHLWYQRP